MLIYKLKNSEIFLNKEISFLQLFGFKFFVLEKYKIYLLVPKFVFFKKLNDSIYFFFPNKNEKESFNFLNYFLNFFRKVSKYNRKRLTLVGLGFRMNVLDGNILSLKVGLSHLINIKIPSNIKIVIIKNNLYLESANSCALGTFANVIKNLKSPDCYKGKGFWFYSEKKKLKPVKKT